jgi:uncharacterized protein YegL
MKCPGCKAEFTPPPGKSVANCPFCAEPLIKSATDQKCEALAEALASIKGSYGADMLLNRERLVAFLCDYLPKGKIERSILANAFNQGVPAKLAAAKAESAQEQGIVMSRCIQTLKDNYGTDKADAENVLWQFAEAVGWQGRPAAKPELQPEAKPAPSAPQPVQGDNRSQQPIFFLIDCSGSMDGSRMFYVNALMQELLKDMADNGADALGVKVAVLRFAIGCTWQVFPPKAPGQIEWQPLVADGLTDLGAACEELVKNAPKNPTAAPLIILLMDGEPTDDYKKGLEQMQGNEWLKSRICYALPIGDCADLYALREFAGSGETVLPTALNANALRQNVYDIINANIKLDKKLTPGPTPESRYDDEDFYEGY